MFREYCRFAEYIKNKSYVLDPKLNVADELEELKIILHYDFHKDVSQLNFYESQETTESDFEFIQLEILKRKKDGDPFKTIMFFHRKLQNELKIEMKKLTNETSKKINQLKFANSPEIYKMIEYFSNSFIMKWGSKNPRDLVQMSKEMDLFFEKLKRINNLKKDYIDLNFKKTYINPITELIKNTQTYNLKTISKASDITKMIYTNDHKKLSSVLTQVVPSIKNEIENGVTSLMFACACFPGFLKKDSKETKSNNLQVLNLLLMYGSDPYQKDMLGYDAFDYVKHGSVIFGHERPEYPTKQEIYDLFKRHSYEKKTVPRAIQQKERDFPSLEEVELSLSLLPIKEFKESNGSEPKELDILIE
jgi:hypothetical protein